MIKGLLATTRHTPDGDREAWISLDHVIAMSINPNGPGVYVETARGPMLVVVAEGETIDTVGDLVAVMNGIDAADDLLVKIHAAAWDLSMSASAACYRVTEILTDAGWTDPHAESTSDAHRSRRAADFVEEPF